MANTAVIVLDLQVGILDIVRDHIDPEFLPRTASTLAAARKANIPIIQITTSFRPGFEDAMPHHKNNAQLKESGKFTDGSPEVQLHSIIGADAGDDLHVKKTRISALFGTNVDSMLRNNGITNVVLVGVATSGAVLSTTRAASDMDYKITILSDLCADRDQEVHQVLIGKVLPKQAEVITADEWVTSISP
ncbi:isochorismatase hydrolase [Xylariaceae sp. FL1272]|nr:isochorismatase hydrolase [Xylariaceae sp. FL1272]